jgi:hypothetical protein
MLNKDSLMFCEPFKCHAIISCLWCSPFYTENDVKVTSDVSGDGIFVQCFFLFVENYQCHNTCNSI